MSYASTTDLQLRVPEVTSISVAAQQVALDDAETLIDSVVFGSRTVLAHCYLAAHFLACRYPSALGGERGPVSSLSAGEISSSWATATPVASEGSPNSTAWGRRYLEIESRTLHQPVGV